MPRAFSCSIIFSVAFWALLSRTKTKYCCSVCHSGRSVSLDDFSDTPIQHLMSLDCFSVCQFRGLASLDCFCQKSYCFWSNLNCFPAPQFGGLVSLYCFPSHHFGCIVFLYCFSGHQHGAIVCLYCLSSWHLETTVLPKSIALFLSLSYWAYCFSELFFWRPSLWDCFSALCSSAAFFFELCCDYALNTSQEEHCHTSLLAEIVLPPSCPIKKTR